MFLGIQIVSIAVLLNIMIGFENMRTLPILSTKWFKRFLHAACLNFIFEAFSLYTLYNMEHLPQWINRLAHQLFFGSIIMTMYCFLMFLDIRARKERRFTFSEFAIRNASFLLIIPVLIFGDVQYHVEDSVRYSYGSMVVIIKIIIGLYLLSYCIAAHFYRKRYTFHEYRTLVFALISTIIIMLIQIFVPWLLMTSMAIALMAMNIYMAFENPRELADQEIHALNKNAFLTMINERVHSGEEFVIVSMTLTNSQIIKEAKGYKTTVDYMNVAAEYLIKYSKTEMVFHPKRDWVSIIFTDRQKYYAFMEEQRELFEQEGHEEHGSGKFFMNILKCPDYASSFEDVISTLDYIDKIKGTVKDKILRIDEKILDDKKFRKQIETIVQDAIDNDGFKVYYQPIYSNKEKRFVSAEALVRLADDKTLGYISPEIFVPIAEENGMIRELGEIVFRKVCQFVSKYKPEDYGVEYIEVNLSGAQFLDDHLNEILSDCAKEYGVPAEFFNLEITETASIAAGDLLEYNVKRLKERRFKFSMDDFGTGYSNLSKIAQTDFDLIKLDKSLIWPCFGTDENLTDARIILESTIEMILKLGKDIVAEGVETEEQVEFLTQHGVNYLQGYYFSRPIRTKDYVAFLKEHNQ